MKNIIKILAVSLLAFLSACNKDRIEKSDLRFNGKKVKTRNVKVSHSSNTIGLDLSDNLDGKDLAFSVGFNLTYLPNNGTYQISFPGNNNSDHVLAAFVWGGVYYLTDRNNSTLLNANSYKNKGKYVVNPTWFFSYTNDPVTDFLIKGNDSILVSGTLYQP